MLLFVMFGLMITKSTGDKVLSSTRLRLSGDKLPAQENPHRLSCKDVHEDDFAT